MSAKVFVGVEDLTCVELLKLHKNPFPTRLYRFSFCGIIVGMEWKVKRSVTCDTFWEKVSRIMMKQQHNKTALQSQHLIADALMALLRRKPYQEITVSELCREAAVGRKTFYRNFETKKDVIDLILEELLETYRKELESIPSEDRLFFHFSWLFCTDGG